MNNSYYQTHDSAGNKYGEELPASVRPDLEARIMEVLSLLTDTHITADGTPLKLTKRQAAQTIIKLLEAKL